jgi:hypothetical protein
MLGMITIDEIRRAERELNALHARVHEIFRIRGKGVAARRKWEEACALLRGYTHPVFSLADAAVLTQIRAGDTVRRQEALLFLEADPWFFRSGYMKEKFLRALKRCALSDTEKERLVRILLAVVDSRDRREFREYCRLASHVTSHDLRQGLVMRQSAADDRVRSRATQMLAYLSETRSA